MKKTKTEIIVKPKEEVTSVDTFISKAIEMNASVETMEKLFALHKEVKLEKAKEAYVVAMSQFQAKCPIIKRNKDVMNKDGKSVRYSYASLDSIVSQVKDTLGQCNLSYSTDVVNETGFIIAVCKITHILGHSETSSFKIPIDTDGYMSAPQKYASALTFAKRYAFCNALGILTGEDDFDAGDVEKKSEIATITSAKGKIMFLLKELGVNTNTADIVAEIKRLTHIDVVDDIEILNEVKSRLEVVLKEKQDATA